MSDKAPAYLVTIVLNPSLKQKYTKKHQKADQVRKGKKTVKEIQEKEYKPALLTLLSPPTNPPTNLPTNTPSTNPPPTKPKNTFFKWLKDNEDKDYLEDEYQRYCA